MKHSETLHPMWLVWVLPVLLIVPNIALGITEQYPAAVKVCNIILPLGVYLLLCSSSTRTGRTTLLMLPAIILAAFQLVLTYLYGESIIAIDMFLNVATTNPGEVAELLGNLVYAIIAVIVIYLPVLIWGICLEIKHRRCDRAELKTPRRFGVIATTIGLILLVVCRVFVSDFSIRHDIFPVNVCANLVDAISRAESSAKYPETSASYRYNAAAQHPDSLREIYVFIIGETSRAENWRLFGYERDTNPRLSVRKGLITYPYTLSESNTTHKSVPMLMTSLTAQTFNDSINHVKGIFEAFKESGFSTVFISNQRRNHSYIDYFGEQAETVTFIRDSLNSANDFMLVDKLKDLLDEQPPRKKLFVVLHSYGSHFNYHERYGRDFRIFTPDDATNATHTNRDQLINAYDNTILFTDALIDEVIAAVDSTDAVASVIYTSDHGEDIFDDSRNRFLHASPTTTFHQINVPLVIWMSDEYNREFASADLNANLNAQRQVSSSRSVFPTIMQLAGIKSGAVDSAASLISNHYEPPQRMYLNDYNQAVTLTDAGFKEVDFDGASKRGISTK